MPHQNMTFSHDYSTRTKPSTPIKIPSRHRQNRAPTPSPPMERPTSPELLFEMSPISSDFHSSAHYAYTFPTPREPEPFMYHFPMFPTPVISSRQRAHETSHRATYLDTTLSPLPILSVTSGRSRIIDDDIAILPTPLIASNEDPSTIKIAGPTPVNLTQLSVPKEACSSRTQRSKNLSPPPRNSSYCSSPWILPGKGDAQEEEIGSMETESSPFEFGKYLMSRMESQNRFRGMTFTSIRE